jgi:hypothetical protein
VHMHGVETLVVLFKCLESSMHKRFILCMGLRHLLFCSSVWSRPYACAFVFMQLGLLCGPLACCFVQC